MIIPVLTGIVSGVISGMGIGGGTILIPALVFILNLNQQTAQCTNLYYFIPTAVSALFIHIKNKNIDFGVSWRIVVFGVIGALLGSFIAIRISTYVLRKIFAVFLFFMGISQFTGNKRKKEKKSE